jgi:hypothetical protein
LLVTFSPITVLSALKPSAVAKLDILGEIVGDLFSHHCLVCT